MRALRSVGEPVPLPSPWESAADDNELTDSLARSLSKEHRLRYYGSGTAALSAAVSGAIECFEPRGRAEVIIPAYACPDVVSAVLFAGALPVVADFSPARPWLELRSVANAMTRDTVAILYVRFLGLPANDIALRALVGNDGPLLIEDAAHAFPLEGPLRSSADFIALSFGRGKPVSLRAGGLLLMAPSPRLAGAVVPMPERPLQSYPARLAHWLDCALYNCAIQPNIYWLLTRVAGAEVDAVRFRPLSGMGVWPCGAGGRLARAVARHRDKGLIRQRDISRRLAECEGRWLDVHRSIAENRQQEPCSSVAHEEPLWRYPLLMPREADRDRHFTRLWRAGYGASRMYRQLLTEMPDIVQRMRISDTPHARDFSRRLLTLPLHSDVRAQDLAGMHRCVA